MKSTIAQLSPKDREILALWYDTPSHKAFRKLIDIERLNLAQDHVEELDILQIRHLSGQVTALKKLAVTLKKNYEDQTKPNKN